MELTRFDGHLISPMLRAEVVNEQATKGDRGVVGEAVRQA
jgi:hypothetical protein